MDLQVMLHLIVWEISFVIAMYDGYPTYVYNNELASRTGSQMAE